MIRTSTLALAIASFFVIAPAHAQLSKLKGMLGGESTEAAATPGSAVPDEAAQEGLVQRFISSQSHSLQAQTSFARAFGLAEQVQLLEAERQALSSGSVDTATIKKSVSVSEAAQAAINERLAAQPELSTESKQHYAEGLVSLLSSANEARQLSGEASKFAAGLQNMGPAQLAMAGRKLSAGIWLAKESPGYIRGLYSSSKSAMTFARQSKIKVPGNAEALLDNL